MSNVIQIKRGIAAPGEDNLAPYELGYVVNRYAKTGASNSNATEEVANGGYLYIGDLKKGESSKTIPVKIKAGYADEAGIANGLSANAKANLSENANVLASNNIKKSGWNGLQYFSLQNANGPTSDTNSDSDAPTDGNWHIIRCNYRINESGYENTMCRTDLALPAVHHSGYQKGSIYFKRVSKGIIQNQGGNNLGWIKILDVENFKAYAEKNKILTGNNFFKFADAQGALTTTNFKDKISSLKPALLDAIYPIGSIYISISSTNPASLFGGTWEQLKDRFLVGAGNSYSAGEAKGSSSTTLTVENLPSHNHGNVQAAFYARDGVNENTDIYAQKEGGNVTITESASGAPEWGNGISTGTRKHYLTEIAINAPTENTGSGTSFSNLPPYLAVYMWKRTA